MKSLKLILAVAFAAMSFSAMAQVNYDDARYAVWGENAEQRKSNMLANQFLKESVDNKDYKAAAGYLKQLLDQAPKGAQGIYTNGIKLYKTLINTAKTEEQRNVYIDSLLYVYDVRLQAFANHSRYGKDYILDRKAREYLTYKPEDREGVRKIFTEAIAATEEKTGKANQELVAIYFSNLCEDYKNNLVDATIVISEYDRFSPLFEGAEGEAAELKNQFDTAFGASGAASCENLESLFSKKLAEKPEDVALLGQAVSLMSRAQCNSDFFFNTAEKFYSLKPSSETALFLAQGFQGRSEFDKAMKYLNEALAAETDNAERAKLYTRIGLISIQTGDHSNAMNAAKEIKTLEPTNGYAPYIMAQCYAATASGDFSAQAGYWAAYDTMNQAIELLGSEPAIQEAAKKMASAYRGSFPTKEECFFNEVSAGARYTVTKGFASGVSTTVRYR
ncbi:MAG: enzyme of heme biosynthesis [Alistipes sp.]|jgi:tetratricopeptide (TPR) repeat protein|nr:enzyme of heme biosynthesis [Alistipes sp.]MBQ5618638.1 enzyme of heme biosynthesis [Alistipes sp.]MBQ5703514.1 enzyme of heme biosynthesis [Alistipes sp.]